MGSKQLLQWRRPADDGRRQARHVPVGAPDNIPTDQQPVQGQVRRTTALAPMPGGAGHAERRRRATCSTPRPSPDQIKAGHAVAGVPEPRRPARASSTAPRSKTAQPAGRPARAATSSPAPRRREELQSRKQNANMPVDNFKPFVDGDPAAEYKLEPPKAQADLRGPGRGDVRRADQQERRHRPACSSNAETKVNGILANAELTSAARAGRRPAPASARAKPVRRQGRPEANGDTWTSRS